MGTRDLTEEELAALEDQREFLLGSLDDLEAEHTAGDVDDNDYETLREGYTVRAARVIRTLDAHRAQDPDAPRKPPWVLPVVAVGVALFVVLAGALVALFARERLEGDTLTGDIRATADEEVERAIRMAGQGEPEEAIARLDEVLEDHPDHVPAMTYKGWFQFLSGDPSEAVVTLNTAAELDPEYRDAHVFLIVTYHRMGTASNAPPEAVDLLLDRARQELQTLDDLGVPAQYEQLLARVRADLEEPQEEEQDG